MSVKIKKNADKFANCNCCDGDKETLYLWDIEFTSREHKQVVKLCSVYMNELKREINEKF